MLHLIFKLIYASVLWKLIGFIWFIGNIGGIVGSILGWSLFTIIRSLFKIAFRRHLIVDIENNVFVHTVESNKGRNFHTPVYVVQRDHNLKNHTKKAVKWDFFWCSLQYCIGDNLLNISNSIAFLKSFQYPFSIRPYLPHYFCNLWCESTTAIWSFIHVGFV